MIGRVTQWWNGLDSMTQLGIVLLVAVCALCSEVGIYIGWF